MIAVWPPRANIHLAALALVAASGCGQRSEPYGILHDAGLSVDAKTLLILVEHGRNRHFDRSCGAFAPGKGYDVFRRRGWIGFGADGCNL